MGEDPFYKQNVNLDPEKENGEDEKDDRASSLRTYNDDVAQLVQDGGLSTAKMAIAEQEERRRQGIDFDSEEPKKKIGALTKLIISILLIGLGSSAIFFAFKYNLVPERISNLIGRNKPGSDIIDGETFIKISTDNKIPFNTKTEIINNISETKESAGQVIVFKITKTETITDAEGKEKDIEVSITTTDFFKIMESVANNRLIRSLEDDFLLGFYADFENVPFLILKTSDINLSFSEVYQWENSMYADLKEILYLKNEVPEFIEVQIDPTATSTATSTTETSETSTSTGKIITEEVEMTGTNATSTATTTLLVQQIKNPAPKFSSKEFKDLVLLNRDIRAIIDEAGEIILMYSFVDNENIVFTKDINVFKSIVQKLVSKKLVR